jgi:hypothetical protein
MFGGDFGDQIGRFATLTDPKGNQFEVLVDAINGNFFLTKGWKAIRDFYGLSLGAWVKLIFVGGGRFDMKLTDRFHKTITYPVFDPPMNFLIDKTNVQPTFNPHLQPRTSLLCYSHNISNMTISFEKKLSHHDVRKGDLVRCTFPINLILSLVFHELCVNCFHLGFCRYSFTLKLLLRCWILLKPM